MINTIDDLARLQQSKYAALGSKNFYDDLLIYSSKEPDEILSLLRKNFIGIPESYLNIIKRWDINGSVLGTFSLSPLSGKKNSLIEKLKIVVEDPFFPKNFMDKHKFYQIGFDNTDLLCVTAGTDQFKEGEILYIEEGEDIYNPQDSQIHRLAADFEQFLIIAGNLEEINGELKEDDSNYEEKVQEFFERLKILKVPEEYHKAWEMLI